MTELAKKFEERRQHERLDLGEEAFMHTRRSKRNVIIENISLKGMKIISPVDSIPLEQQLTINQDVAIELQTGEKLHGLIVWSIGETAGVFFNDALSEDHQLIVKAKANLPE